MDWWPSNLVCSIGYPSTTKIVQMMTLGWPWPCSKWWPWVDLDLFYGKVKYGKMQIHRISWKVLKILAYRLVNRVVLMSAWRFVSRRDQGHCLHLAKDSHSMTISNISSKATGPNVTKFLVEPPGAEGMEIFTNRQSHDQYGHHAHIW